MSWVSDKAREVVTSALPGFNPDEPPFALIRSVERAIRETLEKCAKAIPLEGHVVAAPVSDEFVAGFKAGIESAQRAIRKLGED